MKRSFHWESGGDEFGGAKAIDVVFEIEHAEDDSGDFEFAAEFDVAFHGGEFLVGVNEVSAAGADHDEDRDVKEFAGGLDDSGAGSGASSGGVGTKLDAVGSGGLCGERVGEGEGADFEESHQEDCTAEADVGG
jgi:hypothetical protein